MAICNIMEMVVESKLETYIPNSGGCDCKQCLEDIKCLALNKLPPKYVNTHKGELFSKVDQIMHRQNSVDVDFAVMNAIDFVRDNPRHEKRDGGVS